MYKRLIAPLVLAFASMVTLAASSHTAYAVTETGNTSEQAGQSQTITIQSGDYLDKIAQENETTYLRMFYSNEEIQNPDLIYPGQQLRIPDASETLAERPLPADVVAPIHTAELPTSQSAVQSAVPQVNTSAPVTTEAPVAPADTSIWDRLAACESGGNWAINTGNGFYGGLQFTLSSWQAVGGSGYPNQASRSEQINRAQLLQAQQGWGAWPACSAELGLL